MSDGWPRGKTACALGATACATAAIILLAEPPSSFEYLHTKGWSVATFSLIGFAFGVICQRYERLVLATPGRLALLFRHSVFILPSLHFLLFLWMQCFDPMLLNRGLTSTAIILCYVDFPFFIIPNPVGWLMATAWPLWLLLGTLQWFGIGLAVRQIYRRDMKDHLARIDAQRRAPLTGGGGQKAERVGAGSPRPDDGDDHR